MKGASQARSRFQQAKALAFGAAIACWSLFSSFAAELASSDTRIVFVEGKVEFSQAGAADWQPVSTNNVLRAGYRLHTAERSRAMLLWADRAVATIGESTMIEILPIDEPKPQTGLHLWRGLVSFFHRDEPGRFRVTTRSAMAGVEGTEFVVAVDPVTEAATLSVIDGKVAFTNAYGSLSLTNLEQAVADPGRSPRRTPGFTVNRVIQWCFYYPGILNADELSLNDAERQALATSISAYRQGDLLAALANYPADRRPQSSAERVYYAALLLSVGLAGQSEVILAAMEPLNTDNQTARLADALRLLIDVVRTPGAMRSSASEDSRAAGKVERRDLNEIATATEALALSYYEQSKAIRDESLKRALAASRRATELAPDFGFAWARVAELEFSFGRTREALEAVRKVLGNSQDGSAQIGLSPRNAQAFALQGFLLAAQNKSRLALDSFDQALAIDPALGNAWLGRGLCKIRLTPIYFSFSRELGVGVRGSHPDQMSALDDLLIAAAVEPQRSLLRSYLGKAWALDRRNAPLARKELGLAMALDPADPTPWLYRALLNEEENRLNEGIRDLEKSKESNENRRVYRSKILLGQDLGSQAVNLARLYEDAGMAEVGLREASSAVTTDYANYSSHLHLANSYRSFLDANGAVLRYETPAYAEYLVANLLAPVGRGVFSPTLSQHEYARLFDADRLGLYSSTEYVDHSGWRQSGALYGISGSASFSLEGGYRSDSGLRQNGDFEETVLMLDLKQELTPRDWVYLHVDRVDRESGDFEPGYESAAANPAIHSFERQEPNIISGYHHQWMPGVHSLVLFGRLSSQFSVEDPFEPSLFFQRFETNRLIEAAQAQQSYSTRDVLYSIEPQQIWVNGAHTIIAGMRYQTGEFHTRNLQTGLFVSETNQTYINPDLPAADQKVSSHLDRASAYSYYSLQLIDSLQLHGGLSYDWLNYPENYKAAPLLNRQRRVDGVFPKLGLLWTPAGSTSIRAAYTRSLAGASFDQSVQIEPTQVAGINQSFRSVVPEAIRGAQSGSMFENLGIALSHRFSTSTYLGVEAHVLSSLANPTYGAFEFNSTTPFAIASELHARQSYREKTVSLTLDQRVTDRWTVGMRYRISTAEFTETYTGLPVAVGTAGFAVRQRLEATMQSVRLLATYNHRNGLYGQVVGDCYSQRPSADLAHLDTQDVWNVSVWVGLRAFGRRADLAVGVLNLTAENHTLHPINLQPMLTSQRSFAARFRLVF